MIITKFLLSAIFAFFREEQVDNEECTENCMTVSYIRTYRASTYLTAKVTVLDTNTSGRLRGSYVVYGEFTKPGGETVSVWGRGGGVREPRLRLHGYDEPGDYKFEVTDIVMSGRTFDEAGSSSLTGSITVPSESTSLLVYTSTQNVA